jgi:signal transduction histidine kinase/DNA-binding response OmpR family regulator
VTRVVVIEDSRTQAQQLAGVLAREGFEVGVCRDGESGLAECLAAPPALVISDIVMPGIDGFEVCRRLKAAGATRAVPVMLLTSLADPTDVVRALAAGADNFLTKPYAAAQLVARVRRLLARAADGDGPPTVEVRGQTFTVASRPAQVLDVLVSSLEAVTARNAELEQSRALAEEALATAERRAQQLRGLTEASLAINSAGSLDAALRAVTGQARALVDAHQAVTTLLAAGGWAEAASTVSLSEPYEAHRARCDLPDEAGFCAAVVESRRALRVTEAELRAHPAWLSASSGRPPLRGWLGAPLIGRDGATLGLVHLCDRRDGDFSESDEAVLTQLAQTASVAIENARLYEEMSRAVKVRDEVVAVVSHDLRNPLNALIMAAAMAEKRPDDAAAVRARLAVIRRSADRMERLIGDLLDVTRIDAGNLVLARERLSAGALVDEAVQSQRSLAESHSLTLRAEVPDGLPAILGDRDRLFQVFANLLGNAVKFTPEGGSIVVSAALVGARVRFTVRDTGPGIAPEHLPHVFDRFWQDRRTAGQGTGLGLSIVKGIAEAHGGEVSVESAPGEGSAFSFTLPLA